jgi:hypothetical protein
LAKVIVGWSDTTARQITAMPPWRIGSASGVKGELPPWPLVPRIVPA